MDVLLKIIHLLAAVILLGNLLMAPFWRHRLASLGDLQVRAQANRTVRLADVAFTLPGWILVLVTGLILAIRGGFSSYGGWLHLSLTLFVGWVVLWHVLVLRARKAMLTASNAALDSGQATDDLTRYERQWARWSYLSALLVIVILVFMVLLAA